MKRLRLEQVTLPYHRMTVPRRQVNPWAVLAVLVCGIGLGIIAGQFF